MIFWQETREFTAEMPMNAKYRIPILTALILTVSFFATFQESVIQIALPNIGDELGVSYASLSIVIIVYTLPLSIFPLPFGKLGDIYTHKLIFILGFSLISIFGILCGIASTLPLIMAARALQGVGLAAIIGSSIPLLRAIYPEDQRAKGIGYLSASISLGFILGPSLGGFAVDFFDWRTIFVVLGGCGLLMILLCTKMLPRSETLQSKFDYIGSLLLVIFMIAMVFIFRPIKESGWTPVETWGLWLLFFVSLGLFIYYERITPVPLFEFSLLQHSVFWRGLVCGMTYIATVKGLTFLLQYYLQSSLGYSPSASGLLWMVMSGAILFSNLAWGRFSDRYGEQRLIVYGGGLRFVALMSLALIPFITSTIENPIWLLGVILIVFGIGSGITATPLTSMIVGAFSQKDTGMVNGIYGVSRNIAGSFGILIFAQTLSFPLISVYGNSIELSSISISFFLAALIAISGITFIINIPKGKNNKSVVPVVTDT